MESTAVLLTHGAARSGLTDRRLAAALAAIAGAINGAAFQAVGYFSANMTGNISIVSDRVALARFAAALFYVGIVVVFVVGAATSTLLISAGLRREQRTIYAIAVFVEGLLLMALGAAEVLLPVRHSTALLVLGSSFLMGWQNAVVTRISGARVRTTHVSGMITDIGIELAIGLDGVLGRKIPRDRAATAGDLSLHLCTVAAFVAGGIVGVIIYQQIAGFLYLVAAGGLLAMAGSALIEAKSSISNDAL